ncbi:UNVERIFIED_CONTAM: signal transduction histidine kinase [Brevibacillus sp. OAP136]
MFETISAYMNRHVTPIWFFILMLLAWLPNAFASKNAMQLLTSFVLFAVYMGMFLIPQHRRNPALLRFAVYTVGVLTLIKGVFWGDEGFGLIIMLAIFIGLRILGKEAFWIAAFFGVTTAVLLFLIHHKYLEIIPFLLTFAGIFSGARGYRIQTEAYRQNQIHLAELQEAHQELQETHAELQEASVNTMQVAVLEERTRIARDIHDELGHSLTSIIVQMRALQFMLKDGPMDAQEAVTNMLDVAKKGLENIRSSVHTLASDNTALGMSPIRAFLSLTQKNTGLTCQLISHDPELALTKEMTIVFYRVIQEAVTNALRHSEATHFHVGFDQNADYLFVTIRDNGKITPKDEWTPGFGLKGMVERIKKINGKVTYFAREPHGFQIDIAVPHRTKPAEGRMQR